MYNTKKCKEISSYGKHKHRKLKDIVTNQSNISLYSLLLQLDQKMLNPTNLFSINFTVLGISCVLPRLQRSTLIFWKQEGRDSCHPDKNLLCHFTVSEPGTAVPPAAGENLPLLVILWVWHHLSVSAKQWLHPDVVLQSFCFYSDSLDAIQPTPFDQVS